MTDNTQDAALTPLPSSAKELLFWQDMTFDLRDKLIERGNRIAELEAQLASVSRELASTDNGNRYYRGFNDGFDHAKASTWQPVDPIGMANDAYADAEIKLCYRRTTEAQS